MNSRRVIGGLTAVLALLAVGCTSESSADDPGAQRTALSSLSTLATPALRDRRYGSDIEVLQRHITSDTSADTDVPPAGAFMTTYASDGLRLYSRLDLPTGPPPASGFPLVIVAHGWIGIEAAPQWQFGLEKGSWTGRTINSFVQAGYAVLTPGYRGHGTVAGVAADGIDFMSAWDNGSYVSPIFYAIDVLNLLDSVPTLNQVEWEKWDQETTLSIDLSRLFITGHSQGGDVALTVLAISGEGSAVRHPLHAGSIWAGTFAPRIRQARVYHAMQTSPQAFLSGDGSWTGSARGRDGSINPDFIFGWPPDWIETVDQEKWTWQHETWSTPTVAQALQRKHQEMYAAINTQVADFGRAAFRLDADSDGRTRVIHDQRLRDALEPLGGFGFSAWLTEPIALHHSDQDFYALPEWNADLCRRVNAVDGRCFDFTYPGNTHGFGRSPHGWFSGPDVTPGYDSASARDMWLFSGADPSAIRFP